MYLNFASLVRRTTGFLRTMGVGSEREVADRLLGLGRGELGVVVPIGRAEGGTGISGL